ncbi:VapE domain-containing protein [Bradyrhizobium liaoningense]
MSVTTSPLEFYARHGAALFPLPAGSKTPGPASFWNVDGAAGSFKRHYSTDPVQWTAWAAEHPGCNFGLVAFASRLIVVDIDTKVGRDEAWTLWCELCAAWQIPVAMPHIASPSGGWHVLFAIPDGVDPATLRQPDAIKSHINVRCIGYVVAAGSTFEGRPYTLLTNVAPYPAPAALIEHCTRRPAPPRASATPPGSLDPGATATLIKWLTEHDAFAAYEDWVSVGMSFALEFGDAGFPIWELTFDSSVTPETAETKWRSFSTEPDAHSVTLLTWMQKAHRLGWKGSIGRSATTMFGDVVASLAAQAGASLPGAPAGIPMDGGQAELTRLALPVLEEFLADTTDAPTMPAMLDPPALPAQMSGHGLYEPLNAAILRVLALAEQPKFKPARCTAALAVLRVAHKDVFEAVARRVAAIPNSKPLAESKIKLAATDLEDRVARAFVKQDAWVTDTKGLPEANNPDNLVTALGIIGAEVRWNAWLNRPEIHGFEWSRWTSVDDLVMSRLKMRFTRTGTRFLVSNEFLKDTLLALSHDTQFDPVLERINGLAWDGQPRLASWLSRTCAVPNDAYHQAVGRNVIGGLVKRARTPGAKHDEVMILIGKQGTAKSTLCRTLALQDDWFTDSVAFDGSPQNIVPQLFGKLVVELAELDGMAKKEVQHIKAFITRQSDNVTLKYKAFASDFERRCIFIGTSNEDSPLVDITGNRRFLPVRVPGEINIAWLKSNIEQIVAEAAHHQKAGDDFSIPREVWDVAAQHQEAARAITDVEARLIEWFSPTEFTKTAFVATSDLIDLSDIAGWRGVHALRSAIMKRLGFEECRPHINGVRTRGWLRKPHDVPLHVEHVTRYLISKSQDGRPRVTIRQAVQSVAPCPVPLPR